MNRGLFKLFALAFNGIASVGDYDNIEGVVTVHVHPAPGAVLPCLDKLNRAYAIAERLEAKTGIVVIVKAAEPALPGLMTG